MCKDILLYKERIGISIEALAEEIIKALQAVAPELVVSYRIKDPTTLQKKIVLKNAQNVFSIDDVYGFRVLVETEDQAYLVLREIEKFYSGYLDHNYLSHPKTRPDDPALRGKKLRMLQYIACKNKVSFEVQITTFEYHEMNESLHATYHLRKYS